MATTPQTGTATLGSSVTIHGEIISREDLAINGIVEGSIDMKDHRLFIGVTAEIRANIESREVIVLGSVHGNVTAAERIELRKDASLIGDIKTARIGIEDGAYLKGAVDISTNGKL